MIHETVGTTCSNSLHRHLHALKKIKITLCMHEFLSAWKPLDPISVGTGSSPASLDSVQVTEAHLHKAGGLGRDASHGVHSSPGKVCRGDLFTTLIFAGLCKHTVGHASVISHICTAIVGLHLADSILDMSR